MNFLRTLLRGTSLWYIISQSIVCSSPSTDKFSRIDSYCTSSSPSRGSEADNVSFVRTNTSNKQNRNALQQRQVQSDSYLGTRFFLDLSADTSSSLFSLTHVRLAKNKYDV